MVVFVSYRRGDTLQMAAAVYRGLRRHHQQKEILVDLPRHSPGVRDKLVQAARESNGLVAIIRRQWAERLGDDGNAVRLEIETALRTRKRIFAVLADGTVMPRAATLPAAVRGIRHF